MGFAPELAINMGPSLLVTGIAASTSIAARERGISTSIFALQRPAGMVQTPSLISFHVARAASLRRAAVSNKNLTSDENGPGASVAFQIAAISGSVRALLRARSLALKRAMPRTMGELKSSVRLACQLNNLDKNAKTFWAAAGPRSSSI